MPAETSQTRSLRGQLASLEADSRRNLERRKQAAARATQFRAEAKRVEEHLMHGSPEMLERGARDWVARYRSALSEVANADSIVLGLAFEHRLIEKRHAAVKTDLESAIRAANPPATAARR